MDFVNKLVLEQMHVVFCANKHAFASWTDLEEKIIQIRVESLHISMSMHINGRLISNDRNMNQKIKKM